VASRVTSEQRRIKMTTTRRASFARLAFACVGLCILFARPAIAAPGEPGTVDLTWGGTGRVFTPVGVNNVGNPDFADAITLSDARLLIAANCYGLESPAVLANPCLARYLPNGSLDPAFGTNGIAQYNLRAGSSDRVVAVFEQTDQKLLLVANCVGICITRLLTDGTIDTSFSPANNGVVRRTFPFLIAALSAHRQTDGALVVVGSCSGGKMCAFRVLSNNDLDGTFGVLGSVQLDITAGEDYAVGVTVEPDGAITMIGTCNSRACAVRLTANGALDQSFNTTGYRLNICPAPTDTAQRIVRQPDGKYLIGALGTDIATGDARVCVERFNQDGSIDSDFADNGRYFANFVAAGGTGFRDLLLQPDGRIIILASVGTSISARRLNGNGTLDPSFAFASGGTLSYSITPSFAGSLGRALPLPNGNFHVAHHCGTGTSTELCSFRFEGGPQAYRGCTLDFDGDGVSRTATDSLLLARMASGFKGAAITAGITFSAGATRTTSVEILRYAVDRCGLR
jgi:uncharacterized delta-60 repeat protein